jgi:RNA polymerase sigma factor (sigma-70 family)
MHERSERWRWVVRYADDLRHALRGRHSPSDADDLAQETLLRVAVSTARLPEGSAATALLRRIARNVAIDRWRRERRLVPLEIAAHVPALELDQELGDLTPALHRLQRSDRRLLAQLAAGERYADLARAEGIDPSVIRQRAARARARVIAAILEEKP